MLPKRRSVRIRGFDYAQPGEYFVTLCCSGRLALLGRIADGRTVSTPMGRVAEETLGWLCRRYPHVRLVEHVVMPNHVHMVLGWDRCSEPPKPLGSLVNAYKATTTGRIRRLRKDDAFEVWQRGMFEHVIEDEADRYEIVEYIRRNPETWEHDHENPNRIGSG